jgi:DNA-binding response OmpR family regulator
MKNKRILMIDDDIPLTQSMRINLEDTGQFEVMIENQSSKAISTARAFKPDLIILDVVMPGLDGGDVSALLKSDPYLSNVPIIMVTALVSNDETGNESMVRSGDYLMMAKPIRFEKLLNAIEKSLAGAL